MNFEWNMMLFRWQVLFCSVRFCSCTRPCKCGGAFTQHNVLKRKQKVKHFETNGAGLGKTKNRQMNPKRTQSRFPFCMWFAQCFCGCLRPEFFPGIPSARLSLVVGTSEVSSPKFEELIADIPQTKVPWLHGRNLDDFGLGKKWGKRGLPIYTSFLHPTISHLV